MSEEIGKEKPKGEGRKPKAQTPPAKKPTPKKNDNSGIEIINTPSVDAMLEDAEAAGQGATARAFSKLMGKLTGNTSESQKAAIDSINSTVQEMGKLGEDMNSEDKLKLADKMADVGKGVAGVNENNNDAWHKIGTVVVTGFAVIVGAAGLIMTRGRIIR